MLCDQQMATSFSVRDILEFDEGDGMIGNGVSPGPIATATATTDPLLLEPIMVANPSDATANAAGYYANYWLENNSNNNNMMADNRMMMPMEEQQNAPTYIALQQHGHHHIQPLPHQQQQHPAIDPAHYDYSYNYMSYDCPAVAEEFSRFREEDETKLAATQQRINPAVSRPLTTSHHVQQLSHLCPPFSEQDVGCGNSMEIATNKIKSNRKSTQYIIKTFKRLVKNFG